MTKQITRSSYKSRKPRPLNPINLHELKPDTKITTKMVFDWAASQFGKHFTAIKMNAMKDKSLVEMWVWFNQFYIYQGYNDVICKRKVLEDLWGTVLELVEDEDQK